MKKIFSRMILVAVLMATTGICLQAQVTIGSDVEPNPGSLLDLKENNNQGANSTRGLGLPRVALSDLKNLYPMYTSDGANGYLEGDKNATDKENVGMVVWNTTYKGNICPGPYVWEGESWNRADRNTNCVYLLASPNKLTFVKTPLAAKTITLEAYPESAGNLTYNFAEKAGHNITWNTFPTNGQSAITYSFLPAANTTSSELKSTAVLTGTATDGTIYTALVDIVQMNRDLNFLYTASSSYSYKKGTYSMSITGSEVDWKIASKTEPGGLSNTIALTDVTLHPISSTSLPYNYKFDLEANWDHLNYRVYTLHMTAPNNTGDFMPVDIQITQSKSAKALHIDFDNAPGDVNDFGNTGTSTPFALKYTTNANTVYNFSGTDWNKVFTATSPASNTVMSATGDPGVDKTQTVTITPNTNISQLHEGPYEGKIDFTTQDHPGVSPITKSLTLKRTVPFYAQINSISGITLNGNTVKTCVSGSANASVTANNDYQVKVSNGGSDNTRTVASTVSNQTEPITWVANSTGAARTVSIDIQKPDGTNKKSYTFKQSSMIMEGGTYINDNLIARTSNAGSCSFTGLTGWRGPSEAEAKLVAAKFNQSVYVTSEYKASGGGIVGCYYPQSGLGELIYFSIPYYTNTYITAAGAKSVSGCVSKVINYCPNASYMGVTASGNYYAERVAGGKYGYICSGGWPGGYATQRASPNYCVKTPQCLP